MNLQRQTQAFSAPKKLTRAIQLLTLGGLSGAVTLGYSLPAYAETETSREVKQYQIPAGSLTAVLTKFSTEAGVYLVGSMVPAEGKQSAGLRGRYTLEEAFFELLKGTGLQAHRQGDGSYTLRQAEGAAESLEPVKVMGKTNRFGDAPAEPGGFKAEYQTTATKTAMSLKETPQAISVVTRDLLDLRQVDSLEHALELTSGAMGDAGGIAAPGGPFTGRGTRAQNYVVRGYSLPSQGLKTDGFAVGSLAEIDLVAYDRVEVIKGPSGFFGQGEIGGIVNLTRKKPKAEFDASISGQVGSYDTYRTEADITGSLTEDESVRGRLVLAHGEEGSFVDHVATDTTVIAPSIEAVINDKTRVLLQMLYQKEEFDVNNGQPAYLDGNQVRLFDVPRSFMYGINGDERSDSEVKDISVRVDHELSDRWLATLLLQGSEINKDAFQGNYGYFYGGYHYLYDRRETYERDRWAGEMRLTGAFDAFDKEHTLLFGVEKNSSHTLRNNGWNGILDDSGNIATIDIYNPNFADYGITAKADSPMNNRVDDVVDIDNAALYAQTVLSLTDRTKLLINARYDDAKFFNTDAAGSYLFNRTDHEVTMRVGLSHEINNNISAYATYGESFTPSYGRGIDGPLDPLRGEGHEVGLKTDWLDNKLGATLAVYRQDLTNRTLPDPNNRDYSIAAGLHRTEGIELEVNGSPMPGLNVALAATWMDNEFLDDRDELFGLAIDGSVKQQYSLYANYELQTGPLKGLATGLMWLRVGDRQVLPYDYNTGQYSQAYTKGYDRVDLDFSYKAIPHWDMSLVIRNVFDEEYIEHGSSYFSQQQFSGAPRSALFKATYKF